MRLLLAIFLLLFAAPAQAQQSQGMSKAMVVSSCGGGTLPTGPVTQLTMDTTGRLCQSGIGSNVCSQATAYLARTTGGNEGGNAVNITALICGLVTDGLITGDLVTTGCGAPLDALWVMAQQNVADAKLNLCGTNFTLLTGTSTFTTYTGFSGFPAAGINSQFNPSTATSPHFTQNSANFGFWSYAVIAEDVGQMEDENNINLIFNKYSGGTFYARVNNASLGGVPTPGTKGLFVGDRSSSANAIPYWDGIAQATQSGASSAPTSLFSVGQGFGVSAQTLCEAHIGGSLGATLNLALYTRLRTYMTAIGVP